MLSFIFEKHRSSSSSSCPLREIGPCKPQAPEGNGRPVNFKNANKQPKIYVGRSSSLHILRVMLTDYASNTRQQCFYQLVALANITAFCLWPGLVQGQTKYNHPEHKEEVLLVTLTFHYHFPLLSKGKLPLIGCSLFCIVLCTFSVLTLTPQMMRLRPTFLSGKGTKNRRKQSNSERRQKSVRYGEVQDQTPSCVVPPQRLSSI